MLLIAMHKNKDYLQSLIPLINREDITDVTIIKRSWIGSISNGDSANAISIKEGVLSENYDKALIAFVGDESKAKELLTLIENDASTKWRGTDDKIFTCILPYAKIKHLESDSSYSKKKEEGIRTDLHVYLKKDNISLNLQAKTKEEAITELAQLLKEEKDVVSFDRFLLAVFAREKLTTTGIGYEIAVPHARTDAVDDIVIAFGRSPSGIDFHSWDGKPVKLVFLIGTPANKKLSAYLKVLGHLSRLLKREDFRGSLLGAATAEEILSNFKKYDEV